MKATELMREASKSFLKEYMPNYYTYLENMSSLEKMGSGFEYMLKDIRAYAIGLVGEENEQKYFGDTIDLRRYGAEELAELENAFKDEVGEPVLFDGVATLLITFFVEIASKVYMLKALEEQGKLMGYLSAIQR